MTIAETISAATVELRRHECAKRDAGREAEAFFVRASGKSREYALLHGDEAVSAATQKKIAASVRRRLAHEPFEFIVGESFFFGQRFTVRNGVLIPRPATELIVAAALDFAASLDRPRFIDVGTGSGCIAVTLAAARPDAVVIATDVSTSAIRLAKKNAAALGVTGRISFFTTSLLGDTETAFAHDSRPTIIVANLPYLPSSMKKRLPKEITEYEPTGALFGGKDGLDFYRALLRQTAASHVANLSPAATAIFVEILPKQYRPLAAFCRALLVDAKTTAITARRGKTVGMRIMLSAVKTRGR